MIDRFERFSMAISEISRYLHRLANETMAKYGLKGTHAIYLTTLYRYPDGLTVSQLCELCGKDKSDASRMLSILEEKKMITKCCVDGSLYRGLIVLTEQGKGAAQYVSDSASRAVEIAGRELDDETREIFYKALESITNNLKILSKEGVPD